MPYRANAGGFLNSGVYPGAPQGIDIGGALHELSGSAQGLIHAAMTRRQFEAGEADRRQRLAIDASRYADQTAYRNREIGLRETTERNRAMAEGITPGSPGREVAPAGDFTIQDTMRPRLAPPVASLAPAGPERQPSDADLPMPGDIGQAMRPQAPATVPHPALTTPATGPSYDPAHDVRIMRVVQGAVARGDQQRLTDTERQGAQSARDTRLAGFRAKAQDTNLAARLHQIALQNQGKVAAKVAGGGAAGEVTTGQARSEALRGKQSDAIMQQFNGDREAAEDFVNNDPQGQQIAKQYGLTSNHLFLAEGRYRGQQAGQAGKIAAAGAATPEEAGAAAATVRSGVKGSKVPDQEKVARATWTKKNPPKSGESFEDYTKRYEAGKGKP